MTTLIQLARNFATKYPTPRSHPFGGDASWDQDCGSLMNRMCVAYGKAPTGDIRSAYIVYERSKIVSKNSARAKPGDFHFWAIAGRANGHVGLDVLGGGHTVFMATNSVTTKLGAGIGFLSVNGYTAAKAGRAVYLGFSHGYANGDVTTSSPKPVVKPVPKPAPKPAPAVVTVKPITPTVKEESGMGFYITELNTAPIYWFNQSTGVKRHILPLEWKIVNAAAKLGAAKSTVVILSKADLAAIPGK